MTMPQQHARVRLHRLATLRLRWTTNNEAYCERVPVDLLRRRHLRITPSTWCGLQLAAETKFEIVKANDNNNNNNLASVFILKTITQVCPIGQCLQASQYQVIGRRRVPSRITWHVHGTVYERAWHSVRTPTSGRTTHGPVV